MPVIAFLRRKGKIDDHEIESLGVVTDNDQGLVVDYTIAFRLFPRYKFFATCSTPSAKDIIAPEHWQYSVQEIP